MSKQIDKAKRKLLRDKYIAAFFDISKTTIISYKEVQGGTRYKAFKSYYNKVIDLLSEDDILYYGKNENLKEFEQILKDLTILNKFNILY